MSVRPLQGGKTVMYNSSVQLGPTSFAKIKRTKFQVSRLRQSRSMYTGIVTGALNLVLWPYYQMTPNKLFIWPPQKTKTIIYVTLPDVESEIFIIKKAKEKKKCFWFRSLPPSITAHYLARLASIRSGNEKWSWIPS